MTIGRALLVILVLATGSVRAQDPVPATMADVQALQKQISDLTAQLAALAQKAPAPSLAERKAANKKTIQAAKALLHEQYGDACRSIAVLFDPAGKITGFFCVPR